MGLSKNMSSLQNKYLEDNFWEMLCGRDLQGNPTKKDFNKQWEDYISSLEAGIDDQKE